VKAGDTVYSIARRFGVQTSALLAANPGVDSRHLRIGQTLNIPRP
jgi:LysM repeat protein